MPIKRTAPTNAPPDGWANKVGNCAVLPVPGSEQQRAIWNVMATKSCHIIVKAGPGTGKTYTGTNGLACVGGSCGFVAFNKRIAEELGRKVPPGVDAKTTHSLGNSAISKAFGRPELNRNKTEILIRQVSGVGPTGKLDWTVKTAVEKLVSLCKANLLFPGNSHFNGDTFDGVVRDLASFYDFDLGKKAVEIFQLVPEVLKACADETKIIDFDDMIWFPVHHALPVYRYSFLLVDEAQDLNRAQQELVLMASHRLMLIGDPFQSIYGFRGADCDSMPNMEAILRSTSLGVEVLPLTLTRRCPKSHVAVAVNLYPDLEATEDAPEGVIDFLSPEKAYTEMKPGCLAICRVNAPLVQYAYQLIRAGIPAVIQGRDIGTGLCSLVKKLAHGNTSLGVADVSEALSDYQSTEETKLIRDGRAGAKLASLQDKCECLRAVMEGCKTVQCVLTRIEKLFADIDDTTVFQKAVVLSSIHRAKGLESEHVFILEPDKLPHVMAKQPWERKQERNIGWVAFTRSKHRMTFVGAQPPLLPPGCLDKYLLQSTTEPTENVPDEEEDQDEDATDGYPIDQAEGQTLKEAQAWSRDQAEDSAEEEGRQAQGRLDQRDEALDQATTLSAQDDCQPPLHRLPSIPGKGQRNTALQPLSAETEEGPRQRNGGKGENREGQKAKAQAAHRKAQADQVREAKKAKAKSSKG